MPAEHAIETALARSWPPEAWQDVTVLLAVSGGADSVALARAMASLKSGGTGRLCAAHLNHQLRGTESDEDEAFVIDLCRQLGVACEVGRVPFGRLAAGGGDGLEDAARKARYGFFRRTAERLGARYLATAHTADDQAETILHRVVRGTGIAGLSGMARTRRLGPAVTVIRPLLGLRRGQLSDYLAELGQPYRRDSSNDDVRFTRNLIRHRLLPQLADQLNPGVVDALVRLGQLAGEVHEVVDHLVDDLTARCVSNDEPGRVEIDTASLAGEPRYVVRQLLLAAWRRQGWPLQAMGFAQWERLAEMVPAAADDRPAASRRITLPGNVDAELRERTLHLVRPPG
jgi:tRNA(Ile)-lysidine synthase